MPDFPIDNEPSRIAQSTFTAFGQIQAKQTPGDIRGSGVFGNATPVQMTLAEFISRTIATAHESTVTAQVIVESKSA